MFWATDGATDPRSFAPCCVPVSVMYASEQCGSLSESLNAIIRKRLGGSMATARVIGTQVGVARRAMVSSLRSAVLDTTATPLGATVAHVDGLKRALALRQQESLAAQEQIAVLTIANAQLTRCAFQREFTHGWRRQILTRGCNR
jgi:hypothetical protein